MAETSAQTLSPAPRMGLEKEDKKDKRFR